jgi:hypothetical protein
MAPGTSAVPAPEPAPPAAGLKEQLQDVLSAMREAQLQKDIVQFMSVYSPMFPGLDDKRAKTLASWQRYDYTNLVFTIDKTQSIDSDNALATITGYVDTKDRRMQDLSSSTQSFQVRFAREMGKWRIRSLEEVKN